ncbi:MAG: S9 family peptidase [Pseudomonadota bacterium]
MVKSRHVQKQNKQSKARRRPITQDDIYQIKYVADAVLSPDGKHAAYVLSETQSNGDEEQQVSSIWLVPVAGGKPRRLTRGQGNCNHPRFAAGGKALLFLSTREKLPQIYSMPLNGGEAVALTELSQGAGPFEVSPDDKLIAFATASAPPATPDENAHVHISRAWYRFDPLPGYLQDTAQSLFLVKPGQKPAELVATECMITGFAFSPDSKQLAFLTSGDAEQEFGEANLNVVKVTGKANRVVVRNQRLNQVVWSGDGKRLISSGPVNGLADQAALIVVDPDSGNFVDRTTTLDIMVGAGVQGHIPVRLSSRLLVDADNRRVLTAVTRGGEVHVNAVSLTGRKSATPISSGPRLVHLQDCRNGTLLVITQDTITPPALALLDRDSGKLTTLTHHNDAWHRQFQWPEVERLQVASGCGITLEGWVMKPKQVRPPYKTILTIHGGPHAGYGCGFWFDMHELVGAGYAVAFMNPRGSTGYGNRFSRAILGCWGDPEFEDFNRFLDELVRLKIAHKDKLGVTGISGGGHLTGWLIGHTNRFRAAVPEQGVYNMLSMWGTSDAGKALIELEIGGAIHKIPEKYWERSPLAYAHCCKTPTRLIQGETDVRCPMEQAEQFYTALEDHGCEVELIRLRNCNHGAQIGGRPALRRYRMNLLRDWFDRYIR